MGERGPHADVVRALQDAAQVCAEIHGDMHVAMGAERQARSTFLLAVAQAVAPAVEAICDTRGEVHEPGAVRAGVPLVEIGVLGRGARIYLAQRDGEGIFVRPNADGPGYLRVSAGEIVREVDLPAAVRRIAERMRASITGSALRRSVGAQNLAEKLFALEVLLRD